MKNKTTDTGFEQAIKTKQEEIESIRAKHEQATDPEELVLLEKQESRALEQLHALEQAQELAAYRPPVPTDKQELLSGVKKYRAEKEERIKTVQTALADLEKDCAEIDGQLHDAAVKADVKRTMALSDQKEDNRKKAEYVKKMLSEAEALPVFPEGAIAHEWEEICNRCKPEWDNAVLMVKSLAAAYQAAAGNLLRMRDTLLDVRGELSKMSEEQGGAPLKTKPFFTADIKDDDITVDIPIVKRLASIGNDFLHGMPL